MTLEYEDLANAIIERAVKDYRAAQKKLKNLSDEKRKELYENLLKEEAEKKTPEYKLKEKKGRKKKTAQDRAVLTFYECENFFRSKWFCVLTTLDGNELIRKLQEEVNA